MTALQNRFNKTLAFLERHTKTDLKYLTKGGFWLSIDEVAGAAAGLLLAVAFANFLPKDVYGTYRFLTAMFWILTAFTMTGLSTAVSRAITKGHEGVLKASIPLSLLWGIPLSVLALGASTYYFINANSVLGYGFIIIALGGPFIQASYLWVAYFTGTKKFRELALWGVVFSFIPAGTLFLTMTIFKDPLILLIGYLASTIVTGFAIIFVIFLRHRPNQEYDNEYKKVGGHFSAMNLLTTIAAQIDKLVVFHYLGAVDLAIYVFATAIPDQIKNVFGSISTLAFPKFIERPLEEIRKNFWNRLWLYTGVLIVVTLLYIAVAPFIFRLLFPAYSEAILYSQIYALALIPIGNALQLTLLKARTANRELYILNILSPIFQIGTLILFTSLYGLMGAIIARIISKFLALFLGNIFVKSYIGKDKPSTS